MLELCREDVGSCTLHVVVTERADGDQRPDRDEGDPVRAARRARRQRALTGSAWAMAAEEHGVGVVDVDADSDPRPAALPSGDVLVSTRPGRALAIWAADCAPLVLCGDNGTLVAAHAGWRGLAAGVVDVAVDELTRRGEQAAMAVLGPSIHAECYEFGRSELAAVGAGVGATADQLTRPTAAGKAGLHVPAAVAAALGRRGVALDVAGPCTACDERWFSHRARGDDGRHAVVAWTSPSGTGTLA